MWPIRPFSPAILVNPPLWPLSTKLHRFIRTQSHTHISHIVKIYTKHITRHWIWPWLWPWRFTVLEPWPLHDQYSFLVYEGSFAMFSGCISTFHFLHSCLSIFAEKFNSVRDLIGAHISIDISKTYTVCLFRDEQKLPLQKNWWQTRFKLQPWFAFVKFSLLWASKTGQQSLSNRFDPWILLSSRNIKVR